MEQDGYVDKGLKMKYINIIFPFHDSKFLFPYKLKDERDRLKLIGNDK